MLQLQNLDSEIRSETVLLPADAILNRFSPFFLNTFPEESFPFYQNDRMIGLLLDVNFGLTPATGFALLLSSLKHSLLKVLTSRMMFGF